MAQRLPFPQSCTCTILRRLPPLSVPWISLRAPQGSAANAPRRPPVRPIQRRGGDGGGVRDAGLAHQRNVPRPLQEAPAVAEEAAAADHPDQGRMAPMAERLARVGIGGVSIRGRFLIPAKYLMRGYTLACLIGESGVTARFAPSPVFLVWDTISQKLCKRWVKKTVAMRRSASREVPSLSLRGTVCLR